MNVKICNKCGKIGLDQIDFKIVWIGYRYAYHGYCIFCDQDYWIVRNTELRKERKERRFRVLKYLQPNYTEYRKIQNKLWKKNNPEKNRQYLRKRYALEAGLEGTFSTEDLKFIYEHQQGICPSCTKFLPFEEMTVDHIIPVSWPGSSNWPDNIQLLCGSCNSGKRNHNDTDFRKTQPILFSELIRTHKPK